MRTNQKNSYQVPLIELKDVTKKYTTPAGVFHALEQINLTFNEGDFACIIGRSGSGKSTLLNLLTGIDRLTFGRIDIQSETISSYTEKQISKWRGEKIGIIFQFFQLMPTLTALENVLLPMDLVGVIPKGNRRKKALGLLEKVGLAAHGHKFPTELSGGEQQRVAIARALANDPKILFADEPTGNLDLENSKKIISLFETLNKEGLTILMVTHEREKLKPASRTIELSDGKILRDEYSHEEVRFA